VLVARADPYLNTDAGTMSPFEHGEVFVLDDGGEVGGDASGGARSRAFGRAARRRLPRSAAGPPAPRAAAVLWPMQLPRRLAAGGVRNGQAAGRGVRSRHSKQGPAAALPHAHACMRRHACARSRASPCTRSRASPCARVLVLRALASSTKQTRTKTKFESPGRQVDLDLGNYERFLDITLTRDNNITTGKIYQVGKDLGV
jgi:hypothetical protein